MNTDFNITCDMIRRFTPNYIVILLALCTQVRDALFVKPH